MNVTGVAFVPMTPLMFRHLSGAADPIAGLREAAVDAVRAACEGAEQVLVLCPVGGREAPGDWRDPSRSGPVYGEPRSLAAQVGEHLLALAGWDGPVCLGPDDVEPDGAVALVVLGDGAAARGQGAPGHIDERSFAFDDAIAAAMATGDGASLAELASTPVAAELLCAGRLSWPAAVALLPSPERAELTHRSDPFGLTYLVAVWRP